MKYYIKPFHVNTYAHLSPRKLALFFQMPCPVLNMNHELRTINCNIGFVFTMCPIAYFQVILYCIDIYAHCTLFKLGLFFQTGCPESRRIIYCLFTIDYFNIRLFFPFCILPFYFNKLRLLCIILNFCWKSSFFWKNLLETAATTLSTFCAVSSARRF